MWPFPCAAAIPLAQTLDAGAPLATYPRSTVAQTARAGVAIRALSVSIADVGSGISISISITGISSPSITSRVAR